MQNFFKAKKNAAHESNQPAPVFQEASSDLDLFTRARMNLMSFKEFFAQAPSNALEPYQIVAASISKAFANLTNRSAELELEKETRTKDMESIKADIQQQTTEKATMNELISEMESRLELLRGQKISNEEQTQEVLLKIQKRREVDDKVEAANKELEDLLKNLDEKRKELNEKKNKSQEADDEYQKVRAELEDKQESTNKEVSKVEQRVKELQLRAKKIEQEQEEAKERAQRAIIAKRRRSSMMDKSSDMFVIQDNLSISDREFNGLREMVLSIENENDELSEEYESKQMDIDCLMQQNLGLKQIIRDIMEPK